MLNTYAEDECCGVEIGKALESGELDAIDRWACPTCGEEWRAHHLPGNIRHWAPMPVIEVWR